MFLIKPARRMWGWVLLAYSVSVAIATIYGRYHYAADALAGFAVSVAAAACLYAWDLAHASQDWDKIERERKQ
jgi:membrane-associated phospholipid phosphatase